MNVHLQDYTDEYLNFIEKWESSGEIYNFLSHSRPKCLCEGPAELWHTTRIFLICLGNQMVGCVWLEDIDFIKKEGKLGIYIGESRYRGLGVGKEVIIKLLNLAFGQLGLNKVILHVREQNMRAINCYKSCGFVVTQSFPRKRFSDGSYQSSFEMTATKHP